MIQVTSDITIKDSEILEEFTRASGPGGQHVNRAATAVQLRFDVANSPSLPDAVRKRLTDLAGNRMTESGVLVIKARRFRSQERNRQDAMNRLIGLIRSAAEEPKKRRQSKPTAGSRRRRLENKRRRATTKRLRRTPREE